MQRRPPKCGAQVAGESFWGTFLIMGSVFRTNSIEQVIVSLLDVFLMIFSRASRSFFVLLTAITFAPACAKAIEQAFPIPFRQNHKNF